MATTSDYIGSIVTTSFVPLVIAAGGAIAARRTRRSGGDALETWIRWWLVGCVVIGASVIAVTFWVIPVTMADQMGYRHTPFQFEVSGANLAFAVMAALAVRQQAARVPVATGFAVFMWLALAGHVFQFVSGDNHTTGNVGIWPYDLLVPLVLLLLVRAQARREASA